MNTELALKTQLGPPEAFYYNCEVNLQLAVESTPTSSAPWCLAVSCRRKNQGNPGGGKKGKKKKEKSSPLGPLGTPHSINHGKHFHRSLAPHLPSGGVGPLQL